MAMMGEMVGLEKRTWVGDGGTVGGASLHQLRQGGGGGGVELDTSPLGGQEG